MDERKQQLERDLAFIDGLLAKLSPVHERAADRSHAEDGDKLQELDAP
jgi:hypothetical protein